MLPQNVPGEIINIENTDPSAYRGRSDDQRDYRTHRGTGCHRQPPGMYYILWSLSSRAVSCYSIPGTLLAKCVSKFGGTIS